MYKIRTNDQALVITGGPEIAVAETINVQDCQFIFDKTWSGLTVYACFKNQNIIEEAQILLDGTYTCKVPVSVTMEPGNLYVGLLGVANGNIVKPTVWQRLAIVIQGVSPSGQIVDGNPTAIAELTQIAEKALESATEAKDIAEQASSEVSELSSRVGTVETEVEKSCKQFTSMPENISGYIGKVIQYIGQNDDYFTRGYHYTPGTNFEGALLWEQIENDFRNLPGVYVSGVPVHYIGASEGGFNFDYWYVFDDTGIWSQYSG